jgi:aminoglycoside phosphotransferase (APT) family kinase protein
MLADQCPVSPICRDVMRYWDATPIDYLGGRSNEHWLVESGRSRFVLRGYSAEPFDDIGYELAVLRCLRDLGWPVPVAVEEPIHRGGRTWCLFTWLPGACRPLADGVEEKRTRGRLLAELHDATSRMAGMGQRGGFDRSDALIRDPALVSAIRAYERIYPAEGHIMRWHLDRAQEAFACLDVETAETIVLHSDFARWNLLFEGERLTGILDFEATHLDYRVADFALSWRGEHDEVINGYQEVHTLTDLDWELLVPVYWSWLFIGVKKEIGAMIAGKVPPHDFEWQVRHLMRRPGLLGRRAPRYPGYTSGS